MRMVCLAACVTFFGAVCVLEARTRAMQEVSAAEAAVINGGLCADYVSQTVCSSICGTATWQVSNNKSGTYPVMKCSPCTTVKNCTSNWVDIKRGCDASDYLTVTAE